MVLIVVLFPLLLLAFALLLERVEVLALAPRRGPGDSGATVTPLARAAVDPPTLPRAA